MNQSRSKFGLQKEKSRELYRPEFEENKADPELNQKLWSLMGKYLGRDTRSIQKSIASHVEYSLAMTRFDFSTYGCYQAVSMSLRDRLIESLNDTERFMSHQEAKTISFLSLEYSLSQLLGINLLNNDLQANYEEALEDIGYKLNAVEKEENRIELGSRVLSRRGQLAAGYMDSFASQNIPCISYGIMYDLAEFTEEKSQHCNPWMISSKNEDDGYKVVFGGSTTEVEEPEGQTQRALIKRANWNSNEQVSAQAIDLAFSGYNTFNTNSLRLWHALPDFKKPQNDTDEESSSSEEEDVFELLEKNQSACDITLQYYPKSKESQCHHNRIKQVYFFAASTVKDILTKFKGKNRSMTDMLEPFGSHGYFANFYQQNQIFLNDFSSAIAILELIRVFLDVYKLPWKDVWKNSYNTVCCAFYSLDHENFEEWDMGAIQTLLPRHYQLIKLINHFFLQQVKTALHKKISKEDMNQKLQAMSMISPCGTKMRLANFCLVTSHRIIFASEYQRNHLLNGVYSHFRDFLPPHTFVTIPCRVNPRKYLYLQNRGLADLITEALRGETEWLSDQTILGQIRHFGQPYI